MQDPIISEVCNTINEVEYFDIEHFKEDHSEQEYNLYIENYKIITIWVLEMLDSLQNKFSEEEKNTFSSMIKEIKDKKELTRTQIVIFIEFILRYIKKN
jgi:hypothetical protein